jgi:hypothetical protein
MPNHKEVFMAEANATPLTPDVFFSEKIAPQFRRRIEDLQRQILTIQQQIQERQNSQGTVRIVIEGNGGGIWCLNVKNGEMKAEKEPAFPPAMTVYQSRAYFDWAASLATDSGLFGPGGKNNQGELTKSRFERLQKLKGLLQFTFTNLPDGSEHSFQIHFGDGERPEKPQTVMSIKAEDAQKLARGEINPQAAVMGGIIKVMGDMALAMQFGAAMM